MERGALPHAPLRPDPAAVAIDDPLYRREADASAGELAGEVEPLERREQAVGVAHVEPRPIVPDEIRRLARQVGDAELDPGAPAGGR